MVTRLRMLGVVLCLMLIAAATGQTASAAKISGELKEWHRVSLTFDGPRTSETANPNPFLTYRAHRQQLLPDHLLTPVGATGVNRYGKEPGAQAALPTKPFEVHVGRQEDLLSHVFHVAGPPQKPVGEARYLSRIPGHERVKRTFVSPAECRNQGLIRYPFGHNYLLRYSGGGKSYRKSSWRPT